MIALIDVYNICADIPDTRCADSSVASPVSILSVWIVKDNPNQSSCIVIVVFSNHDMSNKAAKRSPAQHNSTQLFCSYTLIRLFLHTSCAAHPVAGGAHWHKQLEGKEYLQCWT